MKKGKLINMFRDKHVIPNKGIAYSKLLEEFMAPFIKELSEFEDVDEMFDFSINTWNFGNLSILSSKEEFKTVMDTTPTKGLDVRLLKKMIAHKATHFKEHTLFIVDFELDQSSGEPILRVITQSEQDYITDMLNDTEDEPTPDDYNQNYINRSAIVLKPLQPFLDWITKFDPEDPIDEIEESRMYLISEEIEDIDVWLKKKYDSFFMMELDEWRPNKKEWPQRRSYKMFKQWFTVEISTMVYDLEKEPVLKIDY